MKTQLILISILLVVLLCITFPAGAQSLSDGKGDLRVMTYNVNEGTDYREVQDATSFPGFLVAVGQTITQVRATDPKLRMQYVAKQVIDAAPALVSLQELDQWASGPLNPFTGQCGDVTVEYDMLPELMDALAQQGAHYTIAVQKQNWAFQQMPGLIPPQTFLCLQVVDTIAILARTDIPNQLQWDNPQSQQFENILWFQTAVGLIPFPRSWVSIDATFNGKAFRFIGTHLDSIDPGINQLQGKEIRLGPANTSLPVIIAMDSNSQAFPLPQASTYVDFMLAGYKDLWLDAKQHYAGGIDPGLTCCQAQLDNNLDSQLYQRIDLLLALGDVSAQRAALFGVTQSSKTPTGLWPSDHAGVAAQITVAPNP
jgi:hypothetical protein